MKSKTTFSVIIALFIALMSATEHINSQQHDLALLHTQLLAFQIAPVVQQPQAPTGKPAAPKAPTGATETKQTAAEFDAEEELFTALKKLQEGASSATQHPYESAFITPIITYGNDTYIILGQENDDTWSAFGGSSDAADVDSTARYFTGRQRSPYITAAREFAEETSETAQNLANVTTITYKALQNRLRQPDVRVIIQNKDYTSRSGQTRRLNTINFIVPFTNAEIQALKRNFKKTSEMQQIAIVKWDKYFEEAVQARKDVMGKIILQKGSDAGKEKPREKITLRGIFGSNMRCLFNSKDKGYTRVCDN